VDTAKADAHPVIAMHSVVSAGSAIPHDVPLGRRAFFDSGNGDEEGKS